jgi:hypothetical protein
MTFDADRATWPGFITSCSAGTDRYAADRRLPTWPTPAA